MKPVWPHRVEVECMGKDALTHDRAATLAREMKRRGRTGMSAYHCQSCGHWHVGGPNPMGKRRDRRKA